MNKTSRSFISSPGEKIDIYRKLETYNAWTDKGDGFNVVVVTDVIYNILLTKPRELIYKKKQNNIIERNGYLLSSTIIDHNCYIYTKIKCPF